MQSTPYTFPFHCHHGRLLSEQALDSRVLLRRVDWNVMQEVQSLGRPLQPGKGGAPRVHQLQARAWQGFRPRQL